jgi:cytochrome c-type biogenesis protein CcmH
MNATFWVISLLMVLVSLGFMLPSILRKPKFGAEDLRVQNILIAKEKLKELEVELKTERISKELYDKRKEELETSLLNDTENFETDIKEVAHSGNAAWVVAIVTPVLAVVLYLVLGTSPDLLNNQNMGQSPNGAQQAQMTPQEMAEKIAERLEREPDNAEGWAMLGQTFMTLKRYPDAVSAFEKSNSLIPNNPQVMFRYADALAMANNSSLEGKPIELINQALTIAPRDMTGLWLSGMYAEEHGDDKKALSQWAILFEVVKGTQYQEPVMQMLTRVNAKVAKNEQLDLAALSATPAADSRMPGSSNATASIEVTITLDDSIKSKVSPTDTVFIYAKAMTGPPMPLAAAKKQVKDLPLTITLDDSMAMMPTMKLSKFQTVKIGARISKSGDAMKPSAGDVKQEVENVGTMESNSVSIVLGGASGSSKVATKSTSTKTNPPKQMQADSSAGNDAVSSRSIKLKVDLDPSLRNKVSATDVVFIYASAMSGPKMPLAAVKRQVQDLPIYLSLDDSNAMTPNFKLSAHDKVRVGARISKSGGAIAKDGDLFNEVLDIPTDGKQPMVLIINQVKGSKNSATAVPNVKAASTNKPVEGGGITVKVTLDKSLMAKTNPEDSIYIYAKAMQGPPMPLAVVRKKVKDLPIVVVLDDAMAMMPTMTLSKFNKVRVGARISKSGNPISQSGDLFNEVSNISNSRSELLSITINQTKP